MHRIRRTANSEEVTCLLDADVIQVLPDLQPPGWDSSPYASIRSVSESLSDLWHADWFGPYRIVRFDTVSFHCAGWPLGKLPKSWCPLQKGPLLLRRITATCLRAFDTGYFEASHLLVAAKSNFPSRNGCDVGALVLPVLTAPNSPSEGVTVAMILDSGAPVELLEFRHDLSSGPTR